jgi:hypothetical protein
MGYIIPDFFVNSIANFRKLRLQFIGLKHFFSSQFSGSGVDIVYLYFLIYNLKEHKNEAFYFCTYPVDFSYLWFLPETENDY